MRRCTIGLDFGSLSGRGVLTDTADGTVLAQAVEEYPHGILSRTLPDGTPLPPGWSLVHPLDYWEGLCRMVRRLAGGLDGPVEQIVGIGVDCTACTLAPVDRAGEPLCLDPRYENSPHAWPKLWKHRAPEGDMERIRRAWREEYGSEPPFDAGGVLPKLLQVRREAPEVFAAAHGFLEMGDGLVSRLTGREVRGLPAALRHGGWTPERGYPRLFRGEDGALPPEEKLPAPGAGEPVLPWQRAGGLSPEAAQRLGLPPGIPVAGPQMDAHAALPALGLEEGQALLMVGTSTGIFALSREARAPAIPCAVMERGVLPGVRAYVSGQSSVGDCFGWFADNALPADYLRRAEERGLTPLELLTGLAAGKPPGGRGLLALDWWNGCKSRPQGGALRGAILGLGLDTRPEDIFLALMEATGFGMEEILRSFEDSGIPIKQMRACGGAALKNRPLMQIYADITGKPLTVSACTQAPALGMAIHAAVAAGVYPTVAQAAAAMACREGERLTPDPARHRRYQELFRDYQDLAAAAAALKRSRRGKKFEESGGIIR